MPFHWSISFTVMLRSIAQIMLKAVGRLRQLPWITGLFGVAALLIFFLPESVRLVFQYDREQILGGEIWRMATGHLVHWNSAHLTWDLVVFLTCGGLLEWLGRKRFLSILILGSILISGGLFILNPEMAVYRGLSALDMGLFSAVCLRAICYCRFRNKKRLALLWSLVLLGCLLKSLLELGLGRTYFVTDFGIGVSPSPSSHIYGIVAALLITAGTYLWEKLWLHSGCSRSFPIRRPSETSIF